MNKAKVKLKEVFSVAIQLALFLILLVSSIIEKEHTLFICALIVVVAYDWHFVYIYRKWMFSKSYDDSIPFDKSPIRFRAYSDKDKQFYYWDLDKNYNSYFWNMVITNEFSKPDRSAGKLDSSGKEIYENDIVYSEHRAPFIIRWNKDCCSFMLIEIGGLLSMKMPYGYPDFYVSSSLTEGFDIKSIGSDD